MEIIEIECKYINYGQKSRFTTSYLKHMAISTLSGISTQFKRCSNPTGKCFENFNLSYTYQLHVIKVFS